MYEDVLRPSQAPLAESQAQQAEKYVSRMRFIASQWYSSTGLGPSQFAKERAMKATDFSLVLF